MKLEKSISEIKVGDTAQFSKTLLESDVYLYARLTGDLNPVHVNEEYAKKTFFRTRIVHGMLLGGLISTVLANKLPGPGTIYVSQKLNFLAPVRIGDTLTVYIEVLDAIPEKNRIRLKTICTIQDGTKVLEGEAVVIPPKLIRNRAARLNQVTHICKTHSEEHPKSQNTQKRHMIRI